MSAEFWAIIGGSFAVVWTLANVERNLMRKLNIIADELAFQNRAERKREMLGNDWDEML